MNPRSFIFAVLLLIIAVPIASSRVFGQSVQTTTNDSSKSLSNPSIPLRDITPVVNDWEPKTASVNSPVELRGFRLDLDEDTDETTKILFIQNGVEVPTSRLGSSGITNDEFNGAQTLEVVVPEQAMLGVGQFIIERKGCRSAPATVTITEWKVPVLRALTPNSGPPGTIVSVECDDFHVDDQIEVTDSAGNLVELGGGGSSSCTAFRVPADVGEGVLTVRLHNEKHGKGQYTLPLTFTVTNDPLPLELVTTYLRSVAPGQSFDLQATSSAPLQHSDRTEVAFTQAGRTIIVPLAKPHTPHVDVPAALLPGDVQLQVRTWRNDCPSQWSQPVSISLADKPVAPAINAIRLEQGIWVSLWPGPDRPQTFTVNPGDAIVMNGLWPVAKASELRISLLRADEVIALKATTLKDNDDWCSDIRLQLQESLALGDWRLIVTSIDGSPNEVPLVIKVIPKASVPK